VGDQSLEASEFYGDRGDVEQRYRLLGVSCQMVKLMPVPKGLTSEFVDQRSRTLAFCVSVPVDRVQSVSRVSRSPHS
jgi:hypothetical protein